MAEYDAEKLQTPALEVREFEDTVETSHKLEDHPEVLALLAGEHVEVAVAVEVDKLDEVVLGAFGAGDLVRLRGTPRPQLAKGPLFSWATVAQAVRSRAIEGGGDPLPGGLEGGAV